MFYWGIISNQQPPQEGPTYRELYEGLAAFFTGVETAFRMISNPEDFTTNPQKIQPQVTSAVSHHEDIRGLISGGLEEYPATQGNVVSNLDIMSQKFIPFLRLHTP